MNFRQIFESIGLKIKSRTFDDSSICCHGKIALIAIRHTEERHRIYIIGILK